MTKDEALRLALEALKEARAWLETDAPIEVWEKNNEAITAIKAALEAKDEIDWKDMYEKEKRRSEMWVAKYEQDIGPLEKAVPQQEAKDEAVAWMWMPTGEVTTDPDRADGMWEPLFLTPPQRTWVGLTHAEIDYQAKKDDHAVYFALGALWAEAKLKAKNT